MRQSFLLPVLLLFAISAMAQISESEKNGLRFMRQEEKLAHDFYAAMLEKWGGAPFSNIVIAEKRHMELIKIELDRFKVADPLIGIEEKRGEFADSKFKKMYDDILAKWLVSHSDAIRMGVLIEETDINDLKTRLNETTNVQITSVYTRLIQGSENHLRAFNRNL